LRVFWRSVPFTQTFYRWKFDDNDGFRRWAAFDQICNAAADQIAPAILRDRLRGDDAIGLEARRIAHLNFGNNIGRHREPPTTIDHRISTISASPPATTMTSPTPLPNSARASGDACEIVPCAGSASSSPTMRKVCR